MKQKQISFDIEDITGKWKKKKSHRYLYRIACNKEVIRLAYKRMRKGKTKRFEILEIENNLESWVEKVQNILANTKPEGWKSDNPGAAFMPREHYPKIIKECGKCRVIYAPDIVELWIQHVIVLVLEPILCRGSYEHSYSSFPGRGSLKGKQALSRWIRSGDGIRNFAQCDIRHFYDHIKYRTVRQKLEKRIHDRLFLHLIDVCMTHFPNRAPLGFYLSQWLANFLLQELDHDIKQKLGVAHYVRYMDNFTLSDNSKKKLHAAIRYIKQWLWKHGLKLKGDWQAFRFDYTKKNGKKTGRRVSAMGWLFYRDRTVLRKHIMLHITRVAKRLGKKRESGKKYPISLCKRLLSLLGWLKHSDTYDCYLMHVKPYVEIRKIKKIISKNQIKQNRRDLKRARMENRAVQCAA